MQPRPSQDVSDGGVIRLLTIYFGMSISLRPGILLVRSGGRRVPVDPARVPEGVPGVPDGGRGVTQRNAAADSIRELAQIARNESGRLKKNTFRATVNATVVS